MLKVEQELHPAMLTELTCPTEPGEAKRAGRGVVSRRFKALRTAPAALYKGSYDPQVASLLRLTTTAPRHGS